MTQEPGNIETKTATAATDFQEPKPEPYLSGGTERKKPLFLNGLSELKTGAAQVKPFHAKTITELSGAP